MSLLSVPSTIYTKIDYQCNHKKKLTGWRISKRIARVIIHTASDQAICSLVNIHHPLRNLEVMTGTGSPVARLGLILSIPVAFRLQPPHQSTFGHMTPALLRC